MRCISCRPLLERYLAGSLRPRQAYAVRQHLSACVECAALLEETKIVDALLLTSVSVSLPSDFTGAAMKQLRALPAPRRKHPAAWAFAVVYLAAAWVAALAWLALTGQSIHALAVPIAHRASHVERAFGSLAGSGRVLGHSTGALLAIGLGILLLDTALLVALLIVYRIVRPHLAAHVSAKPEVS